MIIKRIPLSLCVLNLVLFALFLVIRPPSVDRFAEREVARDKGYSFRMPWQAVTHIAARPLFSWTSWHGGEQSWVKVIEVLNFPSFVIADAVTPHVGRALFPRLGSYYFDSWLRAWIFVLTALMQWYLVGVLVRRLFARPEHPTQSGRTK